MADPNQLFIVAGIVFDSDGSTVLNNVVVTVRNKDTGESHNGNESGFTDLKTNSSGEYSTNLASFTTASSNADIIEVSAVNSAGKSDLETTTVVFANGGDQNVNLTLVAKEIANFFNAITKVGERVDHIRNATTYEEGTIETETATETTITMSHQVVEDEEKLMSWGEVKDGEALMFFKGKDDIQKGDLVRVPLTTGDLWRVQNTPVAQRLNGVITHFESRGVRIDG